MQGLADQCATLQQQLADLTAQNAALEARLEQMGEQITAAANAEVELDLTTPEAQAALASALQNSQPAQQVASTIATEIVASAGMDPTQIPSSSGSQEHGETPTNAAEAQKEYYRIAAEDDPQAMNRARAYRAKHKDLFGNN